MLSLETALSIVGQIKALKIRGKVRVCENIESLKDEEKMLYGCGTEEDKMRIFEKAEKYYAPILKKYYINAKERSRANIRASKEFTH